MTEIITILKFKQISLNSFENEITLKIFTYKSYIYIYLTD